MTLALVIVLLVALQRVGELVYSRRNTERLLARGAHLFPGDLHPFIVLLHTSWLLTLAATVLLGPDDGPMLQLWALIAFIALQPVRLWVLATLGPYWTVRVVTLPGAPMVRGGLYRLLRHPNYAIVALEIPLLPLALDAPVVALVFGLLNLGLLAGRIRVEDRANAARRRAGAASGRSKERPAGSDVTPQLPGIPDA